MLKLDFVSDVSCPWCAIGLAALETALARLAPEIQATLHFQPFELNPQMGAAGQDITEHLSEKYRIDAQQIAANSANIRQRGAAVGFDFGLGQRSRIYNTFDAHRLLHWAGEVDLATQLRLKKSLFTAYFTDGLDPSDHALLQRLATAAGLDGDEAAALLAGDRFAADVREAEAVWQRNGINSVPAVIVNDQYLISGGQPAEVFEQSLRQIASGG
jgi:predicted DsbA family dithiol-disulfide isomerase